MESDNENFSVSDMKRLLTAANISANEKEIPQLLKRVAEKISASDILLEYDCGDAAEKRNCSVLRSDTPSGKIGKTQRIKVPQIMEEK